MSPLPPNHDRVAQLVSQMVDEDLPVVEQAELAALLNADASARRLYLDLVATHAHLQRELSGAKPVDLAAAPQGNDYVTVSASQQWLLVGARHLAVAVSVAALFVLTGLIGMELASDEGGSTQFAATMTLSRDIVWAADQPTWQPGDSLAVGQRLHLTRGMAELTYQSGARVRLSGPIDLEISGNNEAVLHQGAISALVPPAAKGFAVRTLDARIVDLGTRFGASVVGEQTEIVVFDGSVEVHPDARFNSGDQPLTLTADETLRFDRSTGQVVRNASVDVEHFVHIPLDEDSLAPVAELPAGARLRIDAHTHDLLVVDDSPDSATVDANRIELHTTKESSVAYQLPFLLVPAKQERLLRAEKIELSLSLNASALANNAQLEIVGVRHAQAAWAKTRTAIDPTAPQAVENEVAPVRETLQTIALDSSSATQAITTVTCDLTEFLKNRTNTDDGLVLLEITLRVGESDQGATGTKNTVESDNTAMHVFVHTADWPQPEHRPALLVD